MAGVPELEDRMMGHVANAERAIGEAEAVIEPPSVAGLAALAQAHATLAVANELNRMREEFGQLAPPITNGAGEIVGRSLNVAAALRAEGHA